MRYQEFKSLLRRAGVGVGEFADLVGLNRQSLSNYSQGDVPATWSIIAVLAAQANAHGMAWQEHLAKMDEKPKPKQPRGKSTGLRHRTNRIEFKKEVINQEPV